MWVYEKRLQFPVNIKEPNAKMAQFIMSQYGGPDGEMGASMRYLSQRYSMPYSEQKAVLTDIGTEELAQQPRNWKNRDLVRTISTILQGSGLRRLAVCPLTPASSSRRAIR